eukprot:1372074-Amorphochlora_amoeboformis.AAC.4
MQSNPALTRDSVSEHDPPPQKKKTAKTTKATKNTTCKTIKIQENARYPHTKQYLKCSEPHSLHPYDLLDLLILMTNT